MSVLSLGFANQKKMTITDETDSGHHTAHAGGVAAILQIANHPLELVAAALGGHPLVLSGREVGDSGQHEKTRSNRQ